MPIRKLKPSLSPSPMNPHESGTHRISARRRSELDVQSFDVAKVARLRRLLEEGALTIDADLIASKIVDG